MTSVVSPVQALTSTPAVRAARVVLAASGSGLAIELAKLRPSWHSVDGRQPIRREPHAAGIPDAVIYLPQPRRPPDLAPDLGAAQRFFGNCAAVGVTHLVVLSSVAAYGASPDHAGLVPEHRVTVSSDQPAAHRWQTLESLARRAAAVVTVLRLSPILVRDGSDFFSRLFTSGLAFTIAGHDPTLQLLAASDLARAIENAVARQAGGIFNIVPAAPMSLQAGLRLAGRRAIPVPWTVHKLVRSANPRGVASRDQAQFLRCHLTASGEKAARELGFVPRLSSADAASQLRPAASIPTRGLAADDPFGLDRDYIDRSWRGFMGFLHRHYWRVETRGLQHVPAHGGAVLVGMHRGFMPFDGVMTLHSVVRGTGRVPRFLIHPGVGMRFPFLFNLMSKLGGVIACQDNADRILASGELLGVYPEGIRGAFTMYNRAHRIGPSWRNDCVRFALRHQVPLVPFVTIGSAEIFPIVGRIDWRWWKKLTEWPFIPITTPVPLPSKWHTEFLEPLHSGSDYRPDAADDPAIVRAIAMELKERMQAAVTDLAGRRRSRFRGSLIRGPVA